MTLKFTWNVHEINLHLRFNWDLNLIEVCATQSRSLVSTRMTSLFQSEENFELIKLVKLRHYFNHKRSLNSYSPTTFLWGASTKPGEVLVMYICVRGIDVSSFVHVRFSENIVELLCECGLDCTNINIYNCVR